MADVWKVARDVAKLSDGEIVFIGGIATYLHVQRRPKAGLPLESSRCHKISSLHGDRTQQREDRFHLAEKGRGSTRFRRETVMKLPIHMHSVPPPAIRRSVAVPPAALRTTVPDLCRRAGISI